MTTCREHFSLYLLAISCEGLINTVGRCIVSGCNNTKDKENDFFCPRFHGDSTPKAIKRTRKWVSFVKLTRKNLSASNEGTKDYQSNGKCFERDYCACNSVLVVDLNCWLLFARLVCLLLSA